MGDLVLLFDTETTGLFNYKLRADQKGQPRLCSIAAELIDIETRQVVDSMHRLCDGATFDVEDWLTAQAPHAAFAYNGLSSPLMMAQGVPVQVILREFEILEDRCIGYVAYEAPFDLKVMRAERRRAFLDDRYNYRPYFDPKWKLSGQVPGLRAGCKQSALYQGIFGEPIPRTDKSKARDDLHALRRLFLHALDVCKPLEWKFHKTKEAKAAEAEAAKRIETPKPPGMDAAS